MKCLLDGREMREVCNSGCIEHKNCRMHWSNKEKGKIAQSKLEEF